MLKVNGVYITKVYAKNEMRNAQKGTNLCSYASCINHVRLIIKTSMENACLISCGKLFHNLGPK